MKPIALTPLTTEERAFAAENHKLVHRYLVDRKLAKDDWYDVIVFSYLQAVKKWFARPDLRKYRFSTIAWNAMRGAVGNEMEKQGRRIQTISLDEALAGTEGFTHGDTITYENLRYTPYETHEDETMKIRYDVELPERKKTCGRRKSVETLAIEAFLEGDKANMCFEYESEEEAKKKQDAIRVNRKRKDCQGTYDLYRVENRVYIVRTKDLGGNEKASHMEHATRKEDGRHGQKQD